MSAPIGSLRWQLELLGMTALGAAIGVTCGVAYVAVCPLGALRDLRCLWRSR